jgi:allantoin racemase
LVAHRFAVVTTLSRSIPAIETNLTKYGLASRCAKVRACEVPVLALDDPASNASAQISAEIERARHEDRAEAIVLGCAGMADLAMRLSEQHGLPVIDGVASAVKLAEACSVLGLKTSKTGAYATPLPKAYLGVFAAFAPGRS